MKRQIAEWLWRLALLAALAWIGRELRLIHEDMLQPADDQNLTATAPEDLQKTLDALRDDVMALTGKVDAIDLPPSAVPIIRQESWLKVTGSRCLLG